MQHSNFDNEATEPFKGGKKGKKKYNLNDDDSDDDGE